MWRFRGIEVSSEEGPVRSGFIELGDVTVLVGPNDSGKTRVLRSIDVALREPDKHAEVLDLFGVASSEDLAALLDRDPEFGDVEEIGFEAAPAQRFRAVLERPGPDDEVPVGIRPISRVRALPAWTYGKSLAELPDGLRKQIEDDLAAAGSWDMDHNVPLKLEYLGDVDPVILPEPVCIPSAPGRVEADTGAAVVGLTAASWQLLVWCRGSSGPARGPTARRLEPTGCDRRRRLTEMALGGTRRREHSSSCGRLRLLVILSG